MITQSEIRYFAVNPAHALPGYKIELWPMNDTLMLDILENSAQIYPRPGQTDPDLAIFKTVLSPDQERFIADQVGIEDPMSPENSRATIGVLDLLGRVFHSVDELIAAFPDKGLGGTITETWTDEEGVEQSREVPRMKEVIWQGVG